MCMAQTATLEDSQRRGLLPAYVARIQGERILAAEAAGLESLEAAITSLMRSIDGECREVESFVSFITWLWDIRKGRPFRPPLIPSHVYRHVYDTIQYPRRQF